MKQKWVAFISVIAYLSGMKRQTKRPFRARLLFDLVHHQTLKTADEIRLNTMFIQIRHKEDIQGFLSERIPLTDEEREALKAVIVLILPRHTKCEKTYEQDTDLSHQVTYRFTKTQA